MNNVLINKLYIFSTAKENEAKVTTFVSGINVVTSDSQDGNKRGKSTILQSIYYTLGAEGIFDDLWNVRLKIYILDVVISGKQYFIFRQNELFKIFDSERKIVFLSQERRKLAEFLSVVYGFSIKLPQRGNNELKLASPVFSYLLNFIGQDRMKGPQFQSFGDLGEFADFKENLIYAHLGIFDDKYYDVTMKSENFSREISIKKEHSKIVKAMLDKVDKDLEGSNFSQSLPVLEMDISNYQDQYNEYTKTLDETKKNLIKLRNNSSILSDQLSTLKRVLDKDTKEAQELNHNVRMCPECHSEVKITLEMRIQKFGYIDDIYLLISDSQIRLDKISETIKTKEDQYQKILFSLKNYEEKLKINSTHAREILKHKGLITLRDDLVQELGGIEKEIDDLDKIMKAIKKELKAYQEKKDQVNNRYFDLMLEAKEEFELKEIEAKKLKSIGSVFTASGSSLPLATLMWYLSLVKLKNQFNPNAIKFPLIFDSPTNFEKDMVREKALMNFIFKSREQNTQLIVSTLGFKSSNYPEITVDNLIFLDNERYKMLNCEDFEENKDILNEFILAELPKEDDI